MVPLIGVPPGHASAKLAAVTVSGFIASLKLALTRAFNDTPVAPGIGLVELTEGAVVSGAAPVVKVQVIATESGLPATSSALVLILAVHTELAGKLAFGVNVATAPLTA